MGVDLKDIVEFKPLELSDLKGKRIAIDAFNTLYQFLAIIRQHDGTPLMDHKNRVTSHLSGLFYRTVRLLENGVSPIFVFDGKSPEEKHATIQARREVKKEAEKKWHTALEEGDLKEARKYAQGTSRLTSEMIADSKTLLKALGVPFVQAPGEGEAQASYMCAQKDAWAVGSQDFDSLLFGAPRLVRNISMTGKRKVAGSDEYVEVTPETIELNAVLTALGINREQLIEIGILTGTDFNDGIKGIGPKKALAHIREKPLSEWNLGNFDDIKKIFLVPKIEKHYSINFGEPAIDAVVQIMCDEHDFSEERIKNSLSKISESKHARAQRSLDQWG